jgi:hypothetical protein
MFSVHIWHFLFLFDNIIHIISLFDVENFLRIQCLDFIYILSESKEDERMEATITGGLEILISLVTYCLPKDFGIDTWYFWMWKRLFLSLYLLLHYFLFLCLTFFPLRFPYSLQFSSVSLFSLRILWFSLFFSWFQWEFNRERR